MKEFYRKNSVRVIIVIIAVGLVILYGSLIMFNKNSYLTNPTYTRDNVQKIIIDNFIGRLEVTTIADAADDFKLEFSNKKQDGYVGYYPLFKMTVKTTASIDGRFDPVLNCDVTRDAAGNVTSAIFEEQPDKHYNINDYPVVKIVTNKPLNIVAKNSTIFGFIDKASTVILDGLKCSDLKISGVSGEISQANGVDNVIELAD